jgi:hypothetical protein
MPKIKISKQYELPDLKRGVLPLQGVEVAIGEPKSTWLVTDNELACNVLKHNSQTLCRYIQCKIYRFIKSLII